ncbi:MAG: glycoside hydrolase family 3 C-terminal domain-containing protein [Oscillospiraceae bacterium]|nr:glycoside hydrolase family 3 C-terminal domain-containing protein [Oscillospiraceae bacterium]
MIVNTKKALCCISALSLAVSAGCSSGNTDEIYETVAQSTVGEVDFDETFISSVSTEAVRTTTVTEEEVTEEVTQAPAIPPELEAAYETVNGMSTREKLAQIMTVEISVFDEEAPAEGTPATPVTVLPDALKTFLEEYGFGGFILKKQNCSGTQLTFDFTASLREVSKNSSAGIMPFISIDQEGGDITRLMTGTTTCGNMALGALGDENAAKENASVIGSELSALGINMDFAPVCDVNNDPGNPVINVRSFSSDPETVSRMARAFTEGLHEENIITSIKHFPGHGDTSTDSHTGLPLIDKTKEELEAFEFIPFADNVPNADMVMTAHIQYPRIETNTYVSKATGEEIYIPATLSKTILTDILREEMGFKGVIVTDAMNMAAIEEHFDPIDAATMAINAGADMLLMPYSLRSTKDLEGFGAYMSFLESAVNNGDIDENRLNEAVARIIALKTKYGLMDGEEPSLEIALSVVGSEEHHEKELEIAMRAATVVKNDGDLLPLSVDNWQSVLYLHPYENGKHSMDYAVKRLKDNGTMPKNAVVESICYKDKAPEEYIDKIKASQAVIIGVETYRRENMDPSSEKGWQAAFIDDAIKIIHDNDKKVVLLSMEMPYDCARYNDADAIILGYSAQEMEAIPERFEGETRTWGPNYPAVIMDVFGGGSPEGKLPVDIPVMDADHNYTEEILYPAGHGISYKTE